MRHSADRSSLPDNFHLLELERALEILLRAHMFDMETLKRLEAKHKALVDYIKDVVQ